MEHPIGGDSHHLFPLVSLAPAVEGEMVGTWGRKGTLPAGDGGPGPTPTPRLASHPAVEINSTPGAPTMFVLLCGGQKLSEQATLACAQGQKTDLCVLKASIHTPTCATTNTLYI